MQDSCIWEYLELFINKIFLSTVCTARNKILVDAAALQFTIKNFHLGQNQLQFLFWIAQGISVFLEFSTSFFCERAGSFHIFSVELFGVILFFLIQSEFWISWIPNVFLI